MTSRDEKTGRFAAGNQAARGHAKPHAAQVSKLRRALLTEVKGTDVRAIIRKLIDMAQQGDLSAAREVFERTLGKPLPADIEERMAQLETFLEEVIHEPS